MGTDHDDDPVLQRRETVRRVTSIGQRVGYGCFAAATVVFFVGLVAGFPPWVASSIAALLVAGSVVLLPSIILAYGAKAADREDRGEPWGY